MSVQKSPKIRNLGDNLKHFRKAYGYSQQKLCTMLEAHSCKLERITYSKYENGELNIKISVIVTLKELYRCSYDDFFVGLNSLAERPLPTESEQKLRRDMKMGDNLKRLRQKHKYSQEQLCGELQRRGYDIGRTTYSKYENGTLNIRPSVLILLKELYNCKMDDFFDGLKV